MTKLSQFKIFMIKEKFTEWFHRYKYPELAASSTIIFLAFFSDYLEFNKVFGAFFITWGEFLAFYGMVLFLKIKSIHKVNKNESVPITWKLITGEISALFIEFGVAAIIDFFVIRPFFMYWTPIWISSTIFGVILGKILADLFFYTQTILSYEWLKRKKNK